MLCGDCDVTVKLLINECSKITQKKKRTKDKWVEKMFGLELCKGFDFYYATK